MKTTLMALGTVALLFGVGIALEVAGIKWRGVTDPMRAEVRRETFENTQSYTRGAAVDLARYRRQWQEADTDTERDAIASTIRLQFSDLDADKLQSNELAGFLAEIRGY